MIALTAHSEILLKLGPTDLRKSFDGLCGLVRNEFGREPTDGSFFVFVNGRRDRVKILHWERDAQLTDRKRTDVTQGSDVGLSQPVDSVSRV